MAVWRGCLLVQYGLMGLCLGACAELRFKPAREHLAVPKTIASPIPAFIDSEPVAVPKPSAPQPVAVYSVAVDNASVRLLLMRLAREGRFNLDMHPAVEGNVTIQAVDQTLVQLLARIERQVDMRTDMRDGTLSVFPNQAYVEIYPVDYVNIARTGAARMATSGFNASSASAPQQTERGGGGQEIGNSSSVLVNAQSEHQFWQTLTENLQQLLQITGVDAVSPPPVDARVIVHPESGTVAVHARSRQHDTVKRFLAQVTESAVRQVLIEATLVEVTLSKDAQSGVDWSLLVGDGLVLQQRLPIHAPSAAGSLFSGKWIPQKPANFSATLQLLETFGETRVLSSPRIVALNNQTALLRVVDEKVYFTVKLEERMNRRGEATAGKYSSEPHTVSVGVVMSVTPQIANNGDVTLAIRPSLSRVTGYRDDPLQSVDATRLRNRVPEIEVREFESLLRVRSGQTVVLGGLMEDRIERKQDAIPWIHRLPWIGRLFEARSITTRKNELVILLRPIVLSTGASAGQSDPPAQMPTTAQALVQTTPSAAAGAVR